MVDLCAASDVKLIVCHQWRYSPLWRKTHEIIQRGDIGDIPDYSRVVSPLRSAGGHALA